MRAAGRVRIATYNIHKCQGFDRRTLPDRIVSVLRELDADVLCLQEVVNASGGERAFDQAGGLAQALPEYAWCFGANRPLRGGSYGNMTLTRLPLRSWTNHDLTKQGREPRGTLQATVATVDGPVLQIFNVHLGTSIPERRFQAQRLLAADVLGQPAMEGSRVVLGDFNEWRRGPTTALLEGSFETFRPKHGMRFPRTFPGMLPLWTLDHCYFEAPLVLEESRLWRSRLALVASDHLPLVAEFSFAGEAGSGGQTSRM